MDVNMDHIDDGLERFPLEDIKQATNNFAEENIIEKIYDWSDEFDWTVYKGELSGKKLAFISIRGKYSDYLALPVLSELTKHQNIVSLIGTCDEDRKRILVLEHLTRGGLEKYVSSTHFTWLMRLQICLDIASGVHYLQNHPQTCEIDIADLNSANIHLDENWQAKIQFITPRTLIHPHAATYSVRPVQLAYVDPLLEDGLISEFTDIYSFGVILFELLCARPAVRYDEEEGTQFLSKLACSHYEKGTLTEFIDPVLRVQMDRDSFTLFSELAYRCLREDQSLRPEISVVIEQLQKVLKLQQGFETSELQQVQNIQHMKIPLEEIGSAIRDLTIPLKSRKMYKADLSHFNVDKFVAENKIRRVSMEEILEYPRRKSTVAIKSIDGGYGLRTEELLQTLLYLSHENLVKLVGFCDEDDEFIHVVYEYASNGSLDEYIHSQYINYSKYITNPTRETLIINFPWVIRLQYCLDAARGLKFLHDGNGKNDTIIHSNIKSSNILISREGVGMIGDFGLSTNEYSAIHKLTKEYDVFSFGLVLFEVLSGALTNFKISEDDPKFLPDIVKRGFNRKELDNIIDPMLRQEFEKYRSRIGNWSAESLNMFANITYRCFQEKAKGRPTMADVVEELEKAYKYHVESLEQMPKDEDNSKMENLKHLKIPFKEIYSATHGFDVGCMIGWGETGSVYRAELFHVDVRKYVGKKESLVELYGYPRRKRKVALKRITSKKGRKEFWKVIDMFSGLNHQNIISLVGFCYEYGEMIIIYDYASNGSFEKYIKMGQNLKWEQRLQICIDTAQGLKYLHNHHIIHRDVKSSNILLGDGLEGIIGDVGLSITINSADSRLIVNPVGTLGYIDPQYYIKGILTKQSDMYSFGVVLLEVLCGKFVKPPAKGKLRAILVEEAEQRLSQIIGDYLRKDLENEKFLDSVKTFAAITHECLHSTDGDHCLTMADVLKELKKALIVHVIGSEPFSLQEIKSATDNFNDKRVIGSGASGKIYKGELSFSKKSIPVAVQRLDRARSYEEGAFLKEVVKLSRYVHENIITIRGVCEEDGEKILVLENPTRGGLDNYVSSTAHLTWLMRVQISFDIASGVHYLQNHDKPRKLNSASIHLDENWRAKIQCITPYYENWLIYDLAPAKVSGTLRFDQRQLGYADPSYRPSGTQSEIYSFGVILFELLCARPAVTYDEEGGAQFLSKLARSHYGKGTLTEIIDPVLRVQMNRDSFTVFSELAYRCLSEDQSERPTISVVIEQLQKVLKLQQGFVTSELQQVQNIQQMKIPLEEIRSATLEEIRSATRDLTIPHKPGKAYKADLYHFDVDKFFAENKIKRVSMEEISEYPRRKGTVAIKSIDGGYGQQTEELLQTLLYHSHKNLVKLVGFCDEDDERIHVAYEYASNGSLDEYIHRQHFSKKNIFPWIMRLQFCLDAAHGLDFLHNGNGKNDKIIHGNIKSSNILISREGIGMIGDFGLSTNEYIDTRKLTKEYDVFSFGLVLFEVLSGVLTHFKISKDDQELLPHQVKLGKNQRLLNHIIDPMLQKEYEELKKAYKKKCEELPHVVDISTLEDSIDIFAKIAYRCFEKVENRPKMTEIVEELQKAYERHVKSLEQMQEDEDNSKMEKLKHLKIPFKEIYSATHGFVDRRMIGCGGFGGVYRAELFHVDVRNYVVKEESLVKLYGYPRRKGKVALKRREITSYQGREQFWKEIDVLSGLNHQNIISLVGFCYEYGEMIIIYDYAPNESFEKYFENGQNLKWEQLLQICIDAAQGLNYLHNHHIIHRDVKSGNILLGGSLEGIIGDVGLSITINSADSQLIVDAAGTLGYIDPKYFTRGILTKQSDMYSFGVVLLEVLRGEFVKPPGEHKFEAILVEEAEQDLTSNQPSQIIRGYLRKYLMNEKFLDSVKTFAAITHKCLHSTDVDETQRLTMADVLKGLKKALTVHSIGSEPFSLVEINSATSDFSEERVIGSGASGKIYKGELSFSKKSIPVAVKRLDRACSYEEGAFLKEVVKLSRYVHENIITLRGFCEEDDEKIIIMDHASNESLDRHLDKSILTWGIRLKISIGAAKGLNHVHSFQDQNTVHGDIKSNHILLDHDWKATISDFIISKSHGTLGYLDPQYSSTGATKEADVYSFGVVLFELLSGRLAIDKVEKYSHPTLRQMIDEGDGVKDVFLAWIAARCFEEKKLHALVLGDIKAQTDAKSIDILSQVAYECLQKDQEKRPTMGSVIQELEKALNLHEEWECEQKLPKDYEKIMKMTEHPESQVTTKKDLFSLLVSGIRLNNGNVWLSLSEDGKVKEMISATTFSYENCWSSRLKVLENSRFGTVAKISDTFNLKIPIKIKTQFLSLGVIYGAYLVFKFCDPKRVSSKLYVNLRYRTASGTLNSCIVERTDGDWMMIELCRFRNYDQVIDFEVQLKRFCGHPCGNGPIFIDGVEFRPINNVDHEKSVDGSINADSSVNWEKQSPSDYQEIMKRSHMTKEDLDKLLTTGVLIDSGKKLFSLSKVNRKKCHMLPPKAVINKSPDAKFTKCPSSTRSRFEEVVELQRHQAFGIKCDIETKMLSPDTAYACYLVFQLPENSEGLKCPVKARDLLNKNNKEDTIIYLRAPGPIDLYRDKRVPENREDGWMEVRVWEFVYNNEIKDNYIPMELKLVCLGGTMLGLTVCGVEFRPLGPC